MLGSRTFLLLGALFCIATATTPAYSDYVITDIGALSVNASSKGFGVNNFGMVVGTQTTTGGISTAFVSNGTSFTNLGAGGWTNSFGEGINDAGKTVGYLTKGSGVTLQSHVAGSASGGGMVNLSGPLGMTGDSHGYAINSAGQITGDYSTGGPAHAFVTVVGGGVTDLGTLGGNTSAGFSINSQGQVAGVSAIDLLGHQEAFYTDLSGKMSAIGFLSGGTFSTAQGINDSAHVAGFGTSTGGFNQAFFWNGAGSPQALGTLSGGSSSLGLAINNHDVIVGEADVAGGAFHAFVWDQKGGMQDLNTLFPLTGWSQLTAALGVNDEGQITGYGITSSGETHAFLLSPTSSVVPGPPSLLLLGIGGFAAALQRRLAKVKGARTGSRALGESAAASPEC